MDAKRLQDTSLYDVALNSEGPPSPLKISPTTFKSMVESLFDLLVQQEQAATIWAKLPRETVWHAPVQTYCDRIARTEPLYMLRTRKESDASEKDDALDNTTSITGQNTHPQATDAGMLRTRLVPSTPTEAAALDLPDLDLWLAPESRLRREFFVLAITQGLQILILAHRPRATRAQSNPSATPPHPSGDGEDPADRKPPLLSFCCFNPVTIEAVLQAITQSVEWGYHDYPDEATIVQPHIQQWTTLPHHLDQGLIHPRFMDSFWTTHLRQQEEQWRSGTLARRQADKASELQIQNEELLNSVRLKDEFFQTVGQELRTPLSTMKTALSLLGSSSIRPNQRQRYMDLLTQECDRQSALITSVLELVQLDTVDDLSVLQPIRLNEVIPGVVSTYQPLAQEKDVMLAYTVPEDLPAVSCLSPWLRQIVINLLHNAIKFTPEGGRVWVRAKQQGEYVQIEVRDTGIGIAMADIPKIFNRFYRVRSGTGDDSAGPGLGLSIVQQLLLRCGGSVSVNSRQAEGSAFNVLMPIYQQDDDDS